MARLSSRVYSSEPGFESSEDEGGSLVFLPCCPVNNSRYLDTWVAFRYEWGQQCWQRTKTTRTGCHFSDCQPRGSLGRCADVTRMGKGCSKKGRGTNGHLLGRPFGLTDEPNAIINPAWHVTASCAPMICSVLLELGDVVWAVFSEGRHIRFRRTAEGSPSRPCPFLCG